MIDWLVNDGAQGAFVTSPGGVLGYDEVASLVDTRRTGEVSLVAPSLSLDSVRDIYRAVAHGPAIIKSRPGAIGVKLPSSVMTLLFTSGSTGEPKLVPLSVSNWAAAMSASADHLGHETGDVWLLAMPLHHVGGLSILFRSSFVGASVHLLAEFEPASYAAALSDVASMASMVPTMLRRVLDHDRRSYEGLKAVLIGGGPIPKGLLEEAHERGIPALPTYGMTETCAQVATLRPGSLPQYRADLLPGIEARVESDGRLALRGAQVFDGYLGSTKRESEEWFVTGDLGRVTDSSIEVLGRADDVIVTGGENVDPSRVESEMRSVPGVEDAMVVGLESDEWGQTVVALYVGAVSADNLVDHARTVLEQHEIPKHWLRVEAIPITVLGKPDRPTGRKLAAVLSSS